MKKYLFLLFLTIISLSTYAQHIEKDIFGDLKFEPQDESYTASLKKNIFDNLVFSDNRDNEITFEKEYLRKNYPDLAKNEDAKRYFFRQLVDEYKHERNYKASYKIDIFGKEIFEDNRNTKVETGIDFFGNPTYEEKINNQTRSMHRDLSGNLEYNSDHEKAWLKKNIFNRWVYTDSNGNEFEFSEKTWRRLMDKYETEENVLFYLVDEFLKERD